MTGRLLDSDPEGAAAHAAAARRLAPRLAVVREATALAAYVNGEYAAALRDFRALRRMTGSPHHLPLMADCERGLGRPERALELARSEEAGQLEKSERVELRIVEAGARRDLGQLDAAILALSGPDLRRPSGADWWPRLAYAFADALLARGRQEEARLWFARAAEHDAHGETGAVERLAELDGVTFLVETDEPEPDSEESGDGR